MDSLRLVLIALPVLGGTFMLLFMLAKRINNYGIVDIAWAWAFGFLAIFYAGFGPGWAGRRMAIAAMAVGWSARLGLHLYCRVMGQHPVEDGRYRQLRSDWREHFTLKMFFFFQLQAISVLLLAGPFLLACLNPRPGFRSWEIVGAILWLLAIGGESLADFQLAAFKRQSPATGRVCKVGLWRYSRHPNYFFEWLVWVAYLVFALASPHGWLAVISPVSILWLLLRVTGIPLTEEQALRTKGEAYRQYQLSTSAFFPWFPRQPPPPC